MTTAFVFLQSAVKREAEQLDFFQSIVVSIQFLFELSNIGQQNMERGFGFGIAFFRQGERGNDPFRLLPEGKNGFF